MTSVPEVSGGRTIGKGLRHFSMKVCEKVESKGRTTYNEVADELVKDYSTPETTGPQRKSCERPHQGDPNPHTWQPVFQNSRGDRRTCHIGSAPPDTSH